MPVVERMCLRLTELNDIDSSELDYSSWVRGAGSSMAGKPVRSGSEATQRLEELRAAYDRLRTEQIRAEGEAERLEQELEIARAEARAEFGTDDENALAGMIAEAEARNAARVQEFEAVIASIEAELASLAREGA
jgi:hypothetical protein